MVNPIPEGYPSVCPTLVVDGAAKLMDFIGQAFGGTERFRMPMPDGSIAHAEVQVGDSVIMMSDANEQFPASTGSLYMYVEDVDAVYKRALAAGASSEMEPENQFYGDRSASVRDQWGNRWSLSTHVEDVSEEDMMKRMNEAFPQGA